MSLVLFLSNSSKSKIIIPPIMVVSINDPSRQGSLSYNKSLPASIFYARSNLSTLIQNKDKKSRDYLITGGIFTNCRRSQTICGEIFAQISPEELYLYNQSNHRVRVSFRGRIGNKNIRANKNVKLKFRKNSKVKVLPWKADLKIIGDVDESTVTAKNSSGEYTGIFNIRVYLI